MPFLTIITITYHAEAFIEATLESVRQQSNKDFEYIVIDGKSKDGTLAILNCNKDIINELISESDKGIYDAMNKGLSKATGDYVWFMNAGDVIYEKDAVKKLKEIITQMPDVIYSDTMMIAENGTELGLRSIVLPHQVPTELTWQKFKFGMLVCHQSFIAIRSLAPLYIMGNLSADIDWEIKCLKNAKLVVQYPGILSKYLIGGVSNQKQVKSWKDRFIVLQSHFGFFPNILNHMLIVFRAAFRKILG